MSEQPKDKGWLDPIAGEEVLTDDDEMAFGKFKGELMKHVDPSYLDWLSQQDWISSWPTLDAYIAEHRDDIDEAMEEDDGRDVSVPIDADEIPW